MSEQDPATNPEQAQLSEAELRMMGYVASRTGAPEQVVDGQSGEVRYAVKDDPSQLLQPNQIRVAFWDENSESDKPARHSSVTAKLILPTGALEHADWASHPEFGDNFYKLEHNFDATSQSGFFWLSYGEVEMDRLLDESLAHRILDGLEAVEASGRMTPIPRPNTDPQGS